MNLTSRCSSQKFHSQGHLPRHLLWGSDPRGRIGKTRGDIREGRPDVGHFIKQRKVADFLGICLIVMASTLQIHPKVLKRWILDLLCWPATRRVGRPWQLLMKMNLGLTVLILVSYFGHVCTLSVSWCCSRCFPLWSKSSTEPWWMSTDGAFFLSLQNVSFPLYDLGVADLSQFTRYFVSFVVCWRVTSVDLTL